MEEPIRDAVLVLASREDVTADLVVQELNSRGLPVARMDTADFPVSMSLAAHAIDGKIEGRLKDRLRGVDLGSVRSVYFRRPGQFTLAEGMSGPEQRWAYREARMGLGGVLLALDCLYVNDPRRMASAEYKPAQLTTASKCGLTVPRTIVTNNPDEAFSWGKSLCGPIVYKPIGGSVHFEEGRTKFVYASVVSAVEALKDPAVAATAHCFQEWVPKDFEVRVTVVAGRTFAVAIRADSEAGRIDWRSDYSSHRYEVVEVPERVSAALGRYMSAFGLVFGAADFVVSPGGEWTFLELNPNGQWAWLADHCELPIVESIGDLLEKGLS